MLYPGAIVSSLTKSKAFPSWSDLFDMYNLTEAKNASAVVDLQRLEVLSPHNQSTIFLEQCLNSLNNCLSP
jgi:hypothetical protein